MHARARVQAPCSRSELPLIVVSWSVGEDSCMRSGEMKSEDIGRKMSGEGDYLEHN